VSRSSKPPYVQPAIPRSNESEASPAYDAWPPSNWFEGPADSDSEGRPFDWRAPAASFGLQDGYDWTDRVLRLYSHWRSNDIDPSEHNQSGWSALTNAYSIIDDLRRRHLLPHRNLKRWMGSVEKLHSDAEISYLEQAREYLSQAIADTSSIDRRNSEPRLAANWKKQWVSLDGTRYDVSAEAALLVQLLLEQNGELISLPKLAKAMEPDLGVRPLHLERSRDRLPPPILEAIEVIKNKGHRIRREYLG
jgi:hypothetical protein